MPATGDGRGLVTRCQRWIQPAGSGLIIGDTGLTTDIADTGTDATLPFPDSGSVTAVAAPVGALPRCGGPA